MCIHLDSRRGSVEMMILVDLAFVQRVGDRAHRVGVADVSGDLRPKRLAQELERQPQLRRGLFAAGDLRVDKAMQSARGCRDEKVECRGPSVRSAPYRFQQLVGRCGAIGDDEDACGPGHRCSLPWCL